MFGHGSLLSYQLTGSPDFWYAKGRLFGNAVHPQYVSSSARLYAPTGPRQDIEAIFSAIETNVVADPFLAREKPLEANAAYRTALSNFLPLSGDLVIGVEANRQLLETLFAGVNVRSQVFDTLQLYGSWSKSWSGPSARTFLEITAEASPGNIDDHNSRAALAAFVPNRPATVRYGYLTGSFSRVAKLPLNMSLSNQIYAQYSSRALPPSVLFGIGSPDLVRGYSPDDGGFDAGFIARNELHFQSSFIPARLALIRDHISPFVFFDTGYGQDQATKKHVAPNSIGAGFGIQIGQWFASNLDLAYAITRTHATSPGAWRLDYRATVSF